MDNIKPSEVSQVLLEQLKDIDTSLHFEEIGKVLQVSDGVARMYGLTNAEAGELLGEAREAGGARAAPPVDRLVRVADGGHGVAVAEQGTEHPSLGV